MLNAILECHMAGAHILPHKVSAYFYIYIYICMYVCMYVYKRKCTFSPYILVFFHFSPYIFILPFLVPKLINVLHLSPYHHPTNRKRWRGWRYIKIIIKKYILALKNATSATKFKKINLLILTK